MVGGSCVLFGMYLAMPYNIVCVIGSSIKAATLLAEPQVAVLGRCANAEGRRHAVLEASTLPAALAAAGSGQPLPKQLAWGAVKPGQQLEG